MHTILDKLMIEQRTKWIRTTQKYMNEVKLGKHKKIQEASM